jgi:hypothetical protein
MRRAAGPVISTSVMSRFFARRQRPSMSAYFTNRLTPPTSLGLLASPRRRDPSGRTARGSAAPRKMACRLARGRAWTLHSVQGHRLAHREGQPGRCPFQSGLCLLLANRGKMQPKIIRALVWLAALSLFCATTAWTVDHAVFTSVFAALGIVAVLGAAAPRPRR